MYIFADMKFFVDVANVVDKYLLDLHEKSSEKLQEETPELDKAFENAVMALENIENGSKKEEKKGDDWHTPTPFRCRSMSNENYIEDKLYIYESAIKKIEGITEVSISFMTERLVLEYNENMKDEINAVLETLTEREREVLDYRFGLNGKPSMSLKEVGDVFNSTKERIRQIEKKAITRLQHPSRMARLESFVA